MPARGKLSPWIEKMVLAYSGEEQDRGSTFGRLKARVNGVGQLSESQVHHASEGPPGLLFLSDGTVQIPAVLTDSAWHHLQEIEERESFDNLVNTMVYIQNYQLLFHMAPENNKCMFFLSVGELATTSVNLDGDNVPSCAILQSVRQKISETWMSLQGQGDSQSQASQLRSDLSELLLQWYLSKVDDVLEEVREVLKMPGSPQPSTSTAVVQPACPHIAPLTEWEEARDRSTDGICFTVPIKFLLIPEDALQLGTPPDVESRTQRNAVPAAASKPTGGDLPSTTEVEWRLDNPGFVDGDKESPFRVQDRTLHNVIPVEMMDSRPLNNPWDMFPPPCGDSSPESSLAVTPVSPLPDPSAAQPKTDGGGVVTSTQLNPPHSAASVTPRRLSLTSSDRLPPSGQQRPDSTPPNPSALQQESPIFEEEPADLTLRRVKRKRSEIPAEAAPASGKEQEEEALSPPSWLFESGESPRDSEGQTQGGPARGRRKTPTVHSDGTKFLYSYQVSEQNLQDLSRLKVSDSVLHWAVKHLVSQEQTENPQGASTAYTVEGS